MRGNQKHKNYKIKWIPEFAYAIGLLTTDGNLSSDGRHFDFTSKDIQLINTFKKCLGLNVKIGYKTSDHTDKYYPRVQFSNKKLYQYLLSIGLRPNKSKILGKLDIPEIFFFDFLRGHFDGDGCFYSFWDKRWPNSFMFYTNFISASYKHIKWLRVSLKKLLSIKGALGKQRTVWQLKYAKEESLILLPKMYYDINLPCLKRKRCKIEKIIKLSEGRVRELADRHG
tara:strand:- start:415 stop:1092 length:678 start_codon:yes stop_codon:yes gene_type:complete